MLEEIAYLKRYITTGQFLQTAEDFKKTDNGEYLFNLAKDMLRITVNRMSSDKKDNCEDIKKYFRVLPLKFCELIKYKFRTFKSQTH